MRHALILILVAGAGAQTLIPPPGIARAEQRLTPRPGEEKLTCDLAPLPVSLSYSLRYLSGYSEVMRLAQFPGAGHSWTTVIKVTPFLQSPVYLRRRVDVPAVPAVRQNAETAGGFFVGVGHYRVDAVVYDERGRVCRNDWEFDVKGAEKSEHSVMPPNTVAEMALSTFQRAPARTAVVHRLTLLVNAAPFNVRGVQITARDAVTLTSAVAAALEKIPAAKVRLVVFNLDKRQQFFRSEDFDRRDLDKIDDAIHEIQPGVIDVETLQNKTGDIEFLAKLMNDELRASQPSDLAVFLGPRTRNDRALPVGALFPSGDGPRFYFVDLIRRRFPMFGGGPPPAGMYSAENGPEDGGPGAGMGRAGRGLPSSGPGPGRGLATGGSASDDSISRAISKVKGKTFRVATPAEFAKALINILSRTKPAR